MASFEHEAARHEARRRSHRDAVPRLPTGAIVLLPPLYVPACPSCRHLHDIQRRINRGDRGS